MEEFAENIHRAKHRLAGETFQESCCRVAAAITDSSPHFERFRELLMSRFFLPAGRIQVSAGSPQGTTLINCFVSGGIKDSMDGIMNIATEAATTMRKGGGIGYNFSTIRPRGSRITTLGSLASGAVSFISIYNAVGESISSAGDRWGAQMGVLRVDHPDIEEFINLKTRPEIMANFNLSVAMTDHFMECVEADLLFELVFEGTVYKTVSARLLFEKIMRATWDWAEPGILFIDRINEMNNLSSIEKIAATNPCGEQPLPPYGACLLGSINLTKYSKGSIATAMPDIVRAMDIALDVSKYPLEAQKIEAQTKRRIGIGVTGLANHIETEYGYSYGSDSFLAEAEKIFIELRDSAYRASIDLSKEKGAFGRLDKATYCNTPFIRTLPKDIKEGIWDHGIRNSHLISFAPAGTISLTADNISSGIEPTFSYEYTRDIRTAEGTKNVSIKDYAFANHGIRGRTAKQCTVKDHMDVLILATMYSDSAVSKTVNVGSEIQWEEFKGIYMQAWKRGAKGLTTFRADGKRFGLLQESKNYL